MKKTLQFVLIFALLVNALASFSQGGCGGVFTDSGGANGSYSNGENITTTICPDSFGGAVLVSFSSFAVEGNFDFLKVYDGVSMNAPLIGSFTGSTLPPNLQATSTDGCLTFVFTSDTSTTLAGWVANISCTQQSSCLPPTQLNVNNITSFTANASWSTIANTSGFEYAVQLASNTPLPSQGTFISSNNVSLSGLLAATPYKLYVRTLCANNTVSSWVAYNFTTLPLPTPACGGTFTDNGGPTATYFANTDATVTIYPTVAGEFVTVDFLTFDTEISYDGLYIYNGNSINAPQISSGNGAGSIPGGLPGAFWGTASPGTITSTAADGSLTFRFRSDSGVNRNGWTANVVCGQTISCPKPSNVVVSNITIASANFTWTENGTATQWEALVLPAGTVPTASSNGSLVSANTFAATNLTIGTTYNFFVRSICSPNSKSFWSSVRTFTTLSCNTQTQASASNITATSATISWTNTSNQYEYILQTSTTAAPTANSVGTLLSVNSFQANGLIAYTNYRVYLRLICGQSVGNWINFSFTTLDNELTIGQPLDINECNDNLNSCFDLTFNNPNILVNLDPALYTINYYFTAANANAGTNPVIAPVCFANAMRTYYAVLKQLSTGLKQTFNFSINTKTINPTTVLLNITECDNNQAGSVIFNLNDINNQINTTNSLQFYTSLQNAIAGTSSITNANAYSVVTSTTVRTIFVKEIIANDCDNIYSFQLVVYTDCSLGYTCSDANSLCGKLGIPFANTHQNITADPNNNYGCLASQPNPTWFYLPISDPGTLNLTIQQSTDINFATNNLDVDYIVYGPFTNPTTPCATALTTANIVACSFSIAPVEYPIIPNAITGQYYLLMVTNFSNNAGYIKITTATTSTAAIDCSGMRLNAFLDANTNGIKDVGEVNFPLGQFHHEMNSSGIIHNITNHGVYNIYDNNSANLYNVNYTIDPNYTTQYGLTASSYTNISTSNSGMVTYYFPVTIIDYYKDLSVVVLPYTAPRAGTIYKNKVVYTNLGSLNVASGTVTFNNDPATTINAISEPSAIPIANGFTYDYSNLAPFESRVIDVTMSVPPIPTVAINQLLTNTASILPINNDLVPANNYSQTTSAIIAAYDPNDKVEAHGEKILISSFNANDYLTYTIRFENTGNAYAINVNVTDELDAKIDETSIKMIAASHNYTLDRVGSNLSWNFENIQLPVSVPNTEIGKGYITFKAKLKPGFTVGTVVPNTAKIYFDSNPPIITNTFNTEFVTVLATDDFNQNAFRIYPNPVQNSLTIITNQTIEIKELNIYNTLGQLVQTIKNPNKTIDVSSLQTGNYLLKIITDNGVNIQKFNKE